jgi:hypothetical protein
MMTRAEPGGQTLWPDSLAAFEAQDMYLLEVEVNERCIATRLAHHLQDAIPEFSVDAEYNRAGADPKRLGIPLECCNSVDEDGNAL